MHMRNLLLAGPALFPLLT